MSDFIINEDSGFYDLGIYSTQGTPGSVSLQNISVPSGVKLYAQVWSSGEAVGALTQVTSGFTVTNTLYGRNQLKVFLRPDENTNGTDLQLSYDISKSARFGPYVSTIQRDFDIVASEDNPTNLVLSNAVTSEGDQPDQIAVLSATDPDNHPALDYELVFDPTGQLAINYNRLLAPDGLDYEELDATGLFNTDAQGRLMIDIVVRVTDPDGNFNDFNKRIFVTDVDEVVDDMGDDLMQGTDLADTLNGGDGEDILIGGQGNDSLFGDNDDDILTGNAGNDSLYGGNGDDFAKGGGGNDRINGGNGDDTVFGGAGNDRLFGGNGDDQLRDGDGRDWLKGSAGADTFVLVEDGQTDFVQDFEDGVDLLRITGADSFDDLTIRDGAGDRVIVAGQGDRLVIYSADPGFEAADLTVDDFIF